MLIFYYSKHILFFLKGSLGDMEETDENLAAESARSEKDGTTSDPEESADCGSSSTSYSDGVGES